MKIYKFSGFNDDYSIKSIKNNTLWFNTKDKFNDPFDTMPRYDVNDSNRNEVNDIFIQKEVDEIALKICQINL